jgi:hypothetical protein
MSKNTHVGDTTPIKLSYGQIERQVKFLQGKILTVIDASFSNEVQLKAVKDLINRAFSEQMSRLLQLTFPKLPISTLEIQGELDCNFDPEKIAKEAETIK